MGLRNSAVASFLLVFTVVGAGVGYYFGSIQERTSTLTISTTTTVIATTETTAYASVEVLSIQPANLTVGSTVLVNVTFKNTGNVPIFYCSNCGLDYQLEPDNATQRVPAVQCYPRGTPALIASLGPAQSAILSSSTCYKYCTPYQCQFVSDQFVKAGIINIGVVVNWGVNSSLSWIYNSTLSQSFDVWN